MECQLFHREIGGVVGDQDQFIVKGCGGQDGRGNA